MTRRACPSKIETFLSVLYMAESGFYTLRTTLRVTVVLPRGPRPSTIEQVGCNLDGPAAPEVYLALRPYLSICKTRLDTGAIEDT